MFRGLFVILFLGFSFFCVGIFARTNMNRTLNCGRQWGVKKGRSTELRYIQLVRDKRASVWPLVVSIVFIPLGIVLMFGSIFWNNHLRR
jgi:hypothetical protein